MDVKIIGGNNNTQLVLDNQVVDQLLEGKGRDLPVEIHIHDLEALRRYFASRSNKNQKIIINI